MHAGFQLLPALQALEKQEKNREFKRFLQHAQQLIAAGHPLSTADATLIITFLTRSQLL